ncbi:hypothetical protein C8035_v010569 [Colletotrichum spinosum]|uniref:Uncharacterized protein n=1 Tax=Colletotrichum spinosum TaxID=1347390 RepID=A0A4R8Q7I8_9PEZI|nr:hypothetical protein C8035_v010569 [Colletotrichum spinosum]
MAKETVLPLFEAKSERSNRGRRWYITVLICAVTFVLALSLFNAGTSSSAASRLSVLIPCTRGYHDRPTTGVVFAASEVTAETSDTVAVASELVSDETKLTSTTDLRARSDDPMKEDSAFSTSGRSGYNRREDSGRSGYNSVGSGKSSSGNVPDGRSGYNRREYSGRSGYNSVDSGRSGYNRRQEEDGRSGYNGIGREESK